jgi:uncharacterized membrane protein
MIVVRIVFILLIFFASFGEQSHQKEKKYVMLEKENMKLKIAIKPFVLSLEVKEKQKSSRIIFWFGFFVGMLFFDAIFLLESRIQS